MPSPRHPLIAKVLYRRALEGRETAIGLNHPDTLNTVGNLGNLLYEQGHLEETKVFFLRAFEGFEKALGSNHPHTQMARKNLSILNQPNPHVFVNNGSRSNQDIKLEIASIRKALGLIQTGSQNPTPTSYVMYLILDSKVIWITAWRLPSGSI